MRDATVLALAILVGLVTCLIGWGGIMGIGLALAELPAWLAAPLMVPAVVAYIAGMAALWFKLFFGLARMFNVRL